MKIDLAFVATLALISFTAVSSAAPPPPRTMAVTIDDLPAQRVGAYGDERMSEIMEGLISTLQRSTLRSKIPAIGFVNEIKLEKDGKLVAARLRLLERWLDAGLDLGNHGHGHLDLHRVPRSEWEQDVLLGERHLRPLLEARSLALTSFRHPYLHTGLDLETKRGTEAFLKKHGYSVAPVTIDNSEWIFAAAYDAALERDDPKLVQRLAETYLDYMVEVTVFYEEQSRVLFDREIPQILLVHANLLNARHLEQLLERLAARGYRFVDLETAAADEAYSSADTYVGRGGITWLHRWAISRDLDRSLLRGEPRVPEWVQELAGIEE